MPAWLPEKNADGGARFGKRARLTRKTDFRRVFAQPVKSADSYFTVLARSNDKGSPRLGLAVSRKAARSAVVRNRIKRTIRESFRHHRQSLGGIDVIVIGRHGLGQREKAGWLDSLNRHWTRLTKRCARL